MDLQRGRQLSTLPTKPKRRNKVIPQFSSFSQLCTIFQSKRKYYIRVLTGDIDKSLIKRPERPVKYTLRILKLSWSATYRLPSGVQAMALGLCKDALRAKFPSPLEQSHSCTAQSHDESTPATVEIRPLNKQATR